MVFYIYFINKGTHFVIPKSGTLVVPCDDCGSFSVTHDGKQHLRLEYLQSLRVHFGYFEGLFVFLST